MTKAAQVFGKRIQHFMDNDDTQEYMAELAKAINRNPGELVEAKRGNQGGTFGHPKLSVFFARWLDVKYMALRVSR